MALSIDPTRGLQLANILHNSFATTGIHGQKDMPEDLVPDGVERGSLDHILFITLTVAIDYQRDAYELWRNARQTYIDHETQYLFKPNLLHEASFHQIVEHMQKHKLSKKPTKDAEIWHTVGVTFYKKWQGDPRKFLESCNWDALLILARLKSDTHLMVGKRVSDFPCLRGDKIGPLWVRMLRDNVGLTKIRNLENVPIPVDIHVARATMALGVVHGNYKGNLNNLFELIRQAWHMSVDGLSIDGRPMIALDVDEPLWHLSRYGCTNRDRITGNCPVIDRCEAKEFCIKGKVIIKNSSVEIDT